MGNKDFSGIRNENSLPDPTQIDVPSDLDGLLHEYIGSAVYILSDLESVALACQDGNNQQRCAATARLILHKLKGEAGIVGIDDIFECCQEAESAVGELSADELGNMLLKLKDWLEAVFRHLASEIGDDDGEYEDEDGLTIESEAHHQIEIENDSSLRILIVEDDFVCRKLVHALLSEFGDCFIAVNGHEAVEAVKDALDEGRPYDLVCLDIMMPEMDGHEALKLIREIESERGIEGLDGVKVIMTTALGDSKNVIGAFRTGCEAYIVKPVGKEKLIQEMGKLGLVEVSEDCSVQ
jgi:two-component system chemotaxis response regulator CheY